MKTTILVLGLVLAGCGGPDFSGTYTGTLSQTSSCSDGSGGTQALSVIWAVADKGDALTVTVQGGNCGDLQADANGSSATFRQKTCPSVATSGISTTEVITGGSLSLSDKAATVTLNSNLQFSGGASGTCTIVRTGTLHR